MKPTKSTHSSPSERGQGFAEYALILLLVGASVFLVVTLMGPALDGVFSRLVTNAPAAPPQLANYTPPPTVTIDPILLTPSPTATDVPPGSTATPTPSHTPIPTETPTVVATSTATNTPIPTPVVTNQCLNPLASISQSSTSGGNVAERACDGNTDGNAANNSVAKTNSNTEPYWEVNLGVTFILQQIKLFSCTSCSNFLSDVHIFVSAVPFNSTTLAETQTQAQNDPRVTEYLFDGGVDALAFATSHQTTQYIRIQLAGTGTLNLAEVEIIGAPWVPDQCSALADIFYIVDVSGSMRWEFPGSDSKMEAAKDAVIAVNNEIIAADNDTRVGFVTYTTSGTYWLDGYRRRPSLLDTTPMTTDVASINAIVPGWQPLSYTPTADALNAARLTMISTWDPLRIPIVILVTDGVPTVDLDELVYADSDVQAIEVYDGNGDPYTSAEVALTGNVRDSEYYSYKPTGVVVAEVMDEIVELKASLPDATVHSIALGSGGFNTEVLQYVADAGGGQYFAADNASELAAQMSSIFSSIECNPDS